MPTFDNSKTFAALAREVAALDTSTARTLALVGAAALTGLAAIYEVEELTYWALFGPQPGREFGELAPPDLTSTAYAVGFPQNFTVLICGDEWSDIYRRNLRHPRVCARRS